MSAPARQDAIEAAWEAWQESRPDGSPITPLALPDIHSVSEAMFDAGRATTNASLAEALRDLVEAIGTDHGKRSERRQQRQGVKRERVASALAQAQRVLAEMGTETNRPGGAATPRATTGR